MIVLCMAVKKNVIALYTAISLYALTFKYMYFICTEIDEVYDTFDEYLL